MKASIKLMLLLLVAIVITGCHNPVESNLLQDMRGNWNVNAIDSTLYFILTITQHNDSLKAILIIESQNHYFNGILDIKGHFELEKISQSSHYQISGNLFGDKFEGVYSYGQLRDKFGRWNPILIKQVEIIGIRY